jgi:hypothetical protein
MFPDVSCLRRFFDYDPLTGVFRWREAKSKKSRVGDIAGTLHRGYREIKINGRAYPAARIAWAISYGYWPDHEIDHRNRQPDDNRLENLRAATRSENCKNRKVRSDSTVGHKGVKRGKTGFEANIQTNGVRYHLGTFEDPQYAAACYRIAAAALHSEFAG